MRLGIIVTDFPKVTETFVMRDLMAFHRQGHEIRVYHLTRFRKAEVTHDFARPALAWGRGAPYLFGRAVLGALWRAVTRRPGVLLGMLARLARGYRGDPVLLAKSLYILPKSLSFAEDLKSWKVDHVHAAFAAHPATCAWIVGIMTGLPYSVSCHAHDIFVSQAFMGEKLTRARFIRAISQFNRQFLLERIPALRDRTIRVIHCGVDSAGIPALGKPRDGGFRILFVGALQRRKGVQVLLRALAGASFPCEWSCELIGDGPERRRLERAAERLKFGPRLSFLGARSNEEVNRAFKDASVVVVPSIVGPGGRTEGIPVVIMEALAHQRPVVASRLSGIPELIEDGETGYLVPPGDSEALRRVLEQVCRAPDAAFETARRGRRKVIAEFDSETNGSALLAEFAMHRAGRHESPRD